MDAVQFDNQLLSLLGGDAESFPPGARQGAAWQAALAYSAFVPALRRMRTGEVAFTGTASVSVVGGLFYPGDVLTIGEFPDVVQTGTVLSVAVVSDPGQAQQPCGILGLTFVDPLGVAPAVGAQVSVVNPAGVGLAVIQNQDSYPLPLDFIEPNQKSFDEAVGDVASVSSMDSFYDASYGFDQALSGVGYGESMGWGGGSGAGRFPVAYNPAGGGFLQTGAQPNGTTYRFVKGSRPRLVIIPAPVMATYLDFWYLGAHTLASLPVSAMNALMEYALYSAKSTAAAAVGVTGDYEEGVAKYKGAVTAEELRKQAQDHLSRWDVMMRYQASAAAG